MASCETFNLLKKKNSFSFNFALKFTEIFYWRELARLIERFGYKMLKWIVGKKMEMFVLNFYKTSTFRFIFFLEWRETSNGMKKKNIFKLFLIGVGYGGSNRGDLCG